MIKTMHTALLTVTMFTPLFLQAGTPADCTMEKYMAEHALTMIKGGATLQQTLGLFANTEENKHIIEEIFSHRNSIEDTTAASELGNRICLSENANS